MPNHKWRTNRIAKRIVKIKISNPIRAAHGAFVPCIDDEKVV